MSVHTNWNTARDRAAMLDAADPLARFREQFYLPEGRIYLDGNSLGLLSRPAEQALLQVLEQWRTLAIDGWTVADPPWFWLAEQLGGRVAALIGAEPEEVIVTNSTTINLHQLLATLYNPQHTRRGVLVDATSFPSDLYAIKSHLRQRGCDPVTDLKIVPCQNGLLDESDIVTSMTAEIQIAVLPAVVYTTGQLLDLERISAAARERDILIGFDCSHSIGAVPHRLSHWDVDFAFWCSYKYLNAGPGATGGIYLNGKHFGALPGLAGWFGADKRRQFELASELCPAHGAGSLQVGTPHLLSIAPLSGSMSLFEAAGQDQLRAKSLALTEYMIDLFDQFLRSPQLNLVTPREKHRRGGHLALRHSEAARICKALRAAGVVPDHRPPDLIRFALAPMYTRFEDCCTAFEILSDILHRGAFEHVGQETTFVP